MQNIMEMHIPISLHENKFMGVMKIMGSYFIFKNLFFFFGTSFQEPLYPEIFFSQPHNKHEYNLCRISLAMYPEMSFLTLKQTSSKMLKK